MSSKTRAQLLLACAVSMLIGWMVGREQEPPVRAEPAGVVAKPATANAPVFPMSARLGANLYLQTSAEYRACCLQTYHAAEQQLRKLLESAADSTLPPAVVMDLDETVFDNSAFQTFLYAQNLEYTDALWLKYEEQHPQDVTLIPGAKRFIDQAETLGVTVVLLSNRSEMHQPSTIAALKRLGVGNGAVEQRLFLKPRDGSSNKTLRREAVTAKYHVLMYVGDNLRDFSESFAAAKLPADATSEDFAKAIAARAGVVDQESAHWGVDWFILPNPVYGEWEKLLGPTPNALLHPTTMGQSDAE